MLGSADDDDLVSVHAAVGARQGWQTWVGWVGRAPGHTTKFIQREFGTFGRKFAVLSGRIRSISGHEVLLYVWGPNGSDIGPAIHLLQAAFRPFVMQITFDHSEADEVRPHDGAPSDNGDN